LSPHQHTTEYHDHKFATVETYVPTKVYSKSVETQAVTSSNSNNYKTCLA